MYVVGKKGERRLKLLYNYTAEHRAMRLKKMKFVSVLDPLHRLLSALRDNFIRNIQKVASHPIKSYFTGQGWQISLLTPMMIAQSIIRVLFYNFRKGR